MFKGLGLPQIRTANAASRPSRIDDLLAGRLLLRRSSELLQPAFGDDQADHEPFGVPLPDNLAAELTLDRRPCKSGAEPLFVGRRDRRTAPLDPNELQRVAVISAFEIHVAGIRRKRPVFCGVCHELMDHERKAGHCVGSLHGFPGDAMNEECKGDDGEDGRIHFAFDRDIQTIAISSWHSLKPLGSQQVEKPFVSEKVLQGLDDEQKARLRTSAMSLPLIS